MRSLDFGRYALFCIAAIAILAGCGGSQPPIGVQGAMPQNRAVPAPNHNTSWMLPGTSSESLIYVATHDSSAIRIYSYPDGKSLGCSRSRLRQEAGSVSMARATFLFLPKL